MRPRRVVLTAMAALAHLSDLHFGAADEAALASLRRCLESEALDLIAVTGDVTQSGRRSEYEEAAQFFQRLAPPLLIVPGNHDAPVYDLGMRFADPWRRFRQAFGAETDAVRRIDGAVAVGLNSARRAGPSLDWSLGRLSRAQIAYATSAIASAPSDAARIVALHHPLRRGPGRAGEAVVGRAEEALLAFADADADLILTGHIHVADADLHEARGRSMIIARAGTATSTRQRGEAPSFNLIDISKAAATVSVRAFADARYREIRSASFVKDDRGWRFA